MAVNRLHRRLDDLVRCLSKLLRAISAVDFKLQFIYFIKGMLVDLPWMCKFLLRNFNWP